VQELRHASLRPFRERRAVTMKTTVQETGRFAAGQGSPFTGKTYPIPRLSGMPVPFPGDGFMADDRQESGMRETIVPATIIRGTLFLTRREIP